MDITIRKESENDYKYVYKVNKEAFLRDNESELVEKIRLGDNYINDLSLVAIVKNEIVGHIMLSKIEISGKENLDILTLAPMSVIPNYQKIGIGSKLIESAIEKAKELGYKAIIVLGHENYYPKFGFEVAALYDIYPPFDVPDDVFMIKILDKTIIDQLGGQVLYPKEFMEI